MYDRLKDILSNGKEVVLHTPSLLIEMLRIYSKVFLNSNPCEICLKYHSGYFDRLQNEGLQILKKMADNKFKLKDNRVIKDWETGETFTKFNMTDADAIRRLKKYPQRIDEFEEYPENWKELIEDKPDLSKNTVKELKEIAKDKGVALPNNASKAIIIEELSK